MRQVGGRVLDRVLEIVRGDLDRQTDAIVTELLDLRGHGGHSIRHLRACRRRIWRNDAAAWLQSLALFASALSLEEVRCG